MYDYCCRIADDGVAVLSCAAGCPHTAGLQPPSHGWMSGVLARMGMCGTAESHDDSAT